MLPYRRGPKRDNRVVQLPKIPWETLVAEVVVSESDDVHHTQNGDRTKDNEKTTLSFVKLCH